MTEDGIRLTQAEWSVMEYLWEEGPRTGREITERMARRCGWSRSTTLTLLGRLANLVLVGMPGCGKTRIGRLAAQALGRDFVDMDAEIEKAAGMSIPDIFSREGEQGFRDRETRVAEILGARTGLVIATGGGAVLRGENVRALRQNGVIVYMQRSLDQLAVGGNRPLSSSREALEKMLAARAPLYEAAAHRVVFNTGGPPSLARRDVLAAFRQALDAGVL